jgi:hypothetical protein
MALLTHIPAFPARKKTITSENTLLPVRRRSLGKKFPPLAAICGVENLVSPILRSGCPSRMN